MTERQVEPLDDQELVALSRSGDREAFGHLVARYQHEVFTLAVRLVRDRTLAADVAQEAFIRAFRSIGNFRGDSAFSTWLHRITVNTAWTQADRRKRKRTEPIEAGLDTHDTAVWRDPAAAAENTALRQRLAEAVAELPRTQRAVVVLKDVYGWSHAEVAEELSISVTATKVRLHRAHVKLRALLGGQ